jgi:hypothetical protein
VQDLDILASAAPAPVHTPVHATASADLGRLQIILERLAARFRSMPESKLHSRLPDGRSRATAGHELAGLLALAAQGVEDRCRPQPPTWRALPYEGPFVVGDQIGVTGHDLVAACERLLGRGASPSTAPTASTAPTVSTSTPTAVSTPTAASAAAVWAPPGVRCERAGIETILARVLAAAEDLAESA